MAADHTQREIAKRIEGAENTRKRAIAAVRKDLQEKKFEVFQAVIPSSCNLVAMRRSGTALRIAVVTDNELQAERGFYLAKVREWRNDITGDAYAEITYEPGLPS